MQTTRMPLIILVAMTGALWFANVSASVVVTITGRKATADISLPGPGSTTYDAEFQLEFDNPQNLTVACVGIDADVLDAGQIANITSRLPDPVNMSIDPAFPVRVTVEPPSGCGLEFDNDVDVQLHTIDLLFASGSPYRLVKAPVGGAFHDITAAVTSGSVRVRGSTGGFSEFVIVKDNNPSYTPEATALYNLGDSRLANPALSSTARTTLQTDLDVSRAAFGAGNYTAAIAALVSFDTHALSLVGDDSLPNHWRSARDLIDHEGELISVSDALKFTLGRLNGAP